MVPQQQSRPPAEYGRSGEPAGEPVPRPRLGLISESVFCGRLSGLVGPRLRRPPRRRQPMVPAAVVAVLAAGLVAGCGGPSVVSGSGGAPAAGTVGGGDGRSLAGLCPATVVAQTSWFPEATHGGLYQLLGAGYTIDTTHRLVRGPLVSAGVDTGVDIEIRPGGPAKGNQPVSALMYADQAVTLGQQATDEQVLGWAAGQPSVAVVAPFILDPLVYMWDRSRHPDWTTLNDIGQTDARVFTFDSASTDYLTGSGILRKSQLNYSYDGSPSHFMAFPDSAVGGFSTNEPFIYRQLGRTVAYDYVGDRGLPTYRNTLTVRRADLDRLAPCLRRLVPILQRGMVEFMTAPDRVLKLIVELAKAYRSSFPYPIEQARYGVKVMRDDSLVANTDGPDSHLGGFDPARLARIIDVLRPIYAARRTPVPAELTPETIATSTHLDRTIRLPFT